MVFCYSKMPKCFTSIAAVTGFLCTTIVLESSAGEHNCTTSIYDVSNKINCSFLGWTEVPQSLPNVVKVLLLSYNKIRFLLNHSFVKYTILTELYLNGNELQFIQKKTFLPLVYLRLLDISNVHFNHSFTHYWPLNIDHLIMNDNRVERNLTLNDLRNLKIVQAKNCSLFEFPQINENTPVFHLDLNLNPLNTRIFEGLLPLHHLKQLDLQWTSASVMNTTKQWCTCKQVERLLQKRDVKIPNLNCTKSGGIICESGRIGILDKIYDDAVLKVQSRKCSAITIVFVQLAIVTCLAVCVLSFIILNAIRNFFKKETDVGIDSEEESPMQ